MTAPHTTFNRDTAAQKLAHLNLTPANRLFADYWLSMLTAEGRPRTTDLSPRLVSQARRFVCIGETKAGRTAFVRQVGCGVANLLANDITGMDMIETLPAHLRPLRLERTADVACGGIAHNRHRFAALGREVVLQELIVPFGDLSPQGTRMILTHTDFSHVAGTGGKIDARVVAPAVETETIDLKFDDRTVWI